MIINLENTLPFLQHNNRLYASNPHYCEIDTGSEATPLLSVQVIDKTRITDVQIIGEGSFGKVFKGENNDIHGASLLVVVKQFFHVPITSSTFAVSMCYKYVHVVKSTYMFYTYLYRPIRDYE